MSLVLCPACQRHVRGNETACPFCNGSMEGVTARTPGPLLERSRAAVVFFSAAALVGCGKETATKASPDAGSIQHATAVPPYGVAPIEPFDAGPPLPEVVPVQPNPDFRPVPPYGVAPIDPRTKKRR